MQQGSAGPTESGPRLITPNELQHQAKLQMLQGREPITTTDWQRLVNFWAANVLAEAALPICELMALAFECPLPEHDIRAIVEFQTGSTVVEFLAGKIWE